MAIAVAACFPWGQLGHGIRSLGPNVQFEQGIVVATDSQVLIRNEQAVDEGRAVYILEDNAVLVFSGHVESGELAVADLMDYIANERASASVEMPKITQHFLRKAAERISSGRKRGRDPLHVLVGNFDTGPGRASVLGFAQGDDFVPKQGQGVFVSGDETTAQAFGQALVALDAQRTEVKDASEWQNDITIAMRLALESTEDGHSIGGTVQTLRVDKNGMSESGFSYTTADLFDPSTWPEGARGKQPKRKHVLAKVMD